MKGIVFSLLFILFNLASFGQDDLFGTKTEVKTRQGFILNGNISGDAPFADMAKRFGYDYRMGASVTYKTLKNWIFGVKFEFLLGNKIKDDSLMINVRDKYSGDFNGKVVEMLNVDGLRVGVPVYERGYLTGVQGGRIFALNKARPDNGIMILTTLGFIQHKVDIYNRDKDVPSIQGAYLKGYDRLTNGWFAEQYAGYNFFSKNGLLNFNLGVDAVFGFTQGRRDYQYDLMRADNAKRTDIMIGLRGGWMIPIFRRKSEEISFE